MGLAFVHDIWHMYAQKRKHLDALKANILPISLELVPSIGLLNEYLWMIGVPTLNSIPALKALYIAVKPYHFPHGIII